MKYIVTLYAMVCALGYGCWLFALEAGTDVSAAAGTEKILAGGSACIFFGLFLYFAIFQMDKGGEEVWDEN